MRRRAHPPVGYTVPSILATRSSRFADLCLGRVHRGLRFFGRVPGWRHSGCLCFGQAGFGELNESAKTSLAEAQADLNAANQARAPKRKPPSTRPRRESANLEDRVARMDATVSAHRGALDAAYSATTTAERLTRELADDKERLDQPPTGGPVRNPSRSTERHQNVAHNGRVRTAPALLALLVLAGFAMGQTHSSPR